MSEQATTAPGTTSRGTVPSPVPSSPVPSSPVPSSPVPPSTGVSAVDAVLAALAVAFRLPLAEQVAAVEQGHDQLRAALDEPDRSA